MAGAHVIELGAHDGDPSALVAPTPVAGLRRESTYAYATLRDETGDMCSVMRRLAETPSWPARLMVRSNRGSMGLQPLGTLPKTAPSAAATFTSGGGATVASAAADGAEPFELSVQPSAVSWSEGEAMSLTGSEITPGLWWHLLGDDQERYVSRLYVVSGQIGQLAVRGIVGVDEVFLAPGRANYVDDPITSGHLSHAWCTWANAYADGSAEAGHVSFGKDGFAFAVRTDGDGGAVQTNTVTGQVEHGPDGAPSYVRCDIDGEQWQYVADERGFAVSSLPGPVRASEGMFRRVGDERVPVVWAASTEVPEP